jgi:hypothetical protein
MAASASSKKPKSTKPPSPPVDWLLAGDPWVQYRTRVDLLGESLKSQAVQASRKAMIEAAPVRGLTEEISKWPWTVIASHKSAGQPFHKLTFLADIGLNVDDPGIAGIVGNISAHRSDEGPFALPMNGQRAWALCDAPLLAYALTCFGLGKDAGVRAAAGYLVGLVRENGWPCAVSKELGSFRGPGRKDDPCPYANLAMLKLLSVTPGFADGPAAVAGVEALLSAWKNSRQSHPYMFYMGTDFRKLKAPFIWYDILHVLDVLSRFPAYRRDARLQDMLHVLAAKADAEGRFTVESVWTAWKDWEFGQKKEPSRWLTLLAHRVAGRMAPTGK